MIGTIGNPVLVSTNDFAIKNVALIKTNDTTNSFFLLNIFKSRMFDKYIYIEMSGNTQKFLALNKIRSFKFYLPDKDEQDRIGRLLITLDKIITLEQEKLKNYEQSKKELITKLFPINDCVSPELRFKSFNKNWIHRSLSNIATIVGGGTPSTKKKEYWSGDINWFTPTEIGKKIYAFTSSRKITKTGFDNSSAKFLPKNKTILFTSRAGIGDTAILREDASTNQGFQSLILNEKNDIYFIFSMTEAIKRKAIRRASGSTFLEISRTELGKINITIPTYEEQKKIGLLFKTIDQIIALKKIRIELYQDIKKTLLQNLFI